ncbi:MULTISPECIES: flagellin [Halomicrobium]|uniref:Flagellin n=2 Tax=Halomicrobium mukohataei TaxID=57705 RepID=C7NX04_HALMD|nr:MULTISPECIES: flagellin [Halomicrobium]ACV46369.1 flagellin [Halomicrobium mukohataei DSM 12286]QCD64922.1 flagellar protein G [Halomicrobium mukohataei]QFR19728.1 flagellar protein G [Halomicrobium sp. ZPS1]
MAGVSASHLIIFIASMMVAASVVGVFTDSVGQLSDAISEQGVDVSSDVRSDIEIISDSGSDAIYDADGNQNITLHVKNTGTLQLPARADRLDIFVDGAYQTDVEVTLVGGAEVWGAGDVVRLDISEPLDPGDHRVKIVVNGDEEVFEFRT